MKTHGTARWAAIAASVLVICATAATAEEQEGRRFTQSPVDVNRNNKIVYAPLGWGFAEPRPPRMAYNLPTATWLRMPVGVEARTPDTVQDDARYVLESLDAVSSADGIPSLRVAVLRQPAFAADAPPLVRVVHIGLEVSSDALPSATEPVNGGTRYTYLVPAPQWRLLVGDRMAQVRDARYSVLLLPGRSVAPAPINARAPTFGGASVETRMADAPPQLPYAERVAGRRIEFRSAQSPGRVVQERVAGRRQELRRNRRR